MRPARTTIADFKFPELHFGIDEFKFPEIYFATGLDYTGGMMSMWMISSQAMISLVV